MAEQEANSTVLDEAAVNAAAAKEVEQSQTTTEKPVVDSGKGTQKSETNATDKTKTTEQSFDAQARYTDIEKRYKDLQGGFTKTSQENAKYRKDLEEMGKTIKQLQETLAVVTEKPIDLEQFKRDFDAHGPKALEGYVRKLLDGEIAKVREEHNTKYSQLNDRYVGLHAKHEVLIRANDDEHFPDFGKLYPKMCELAADPKCPIDMSQDISEILDALYKLAKDQSSEEAVRIAAAEGAKKAEAEIARESRTTVATGGKTASTSSPDLEAMPLDKLEQLVTQMHGVASRD